MAINFQEVNKGLLEKLNSGQNAEIKFLFPEKSIIIAVNALLAQILGKIDRVFILETLMTIIRECLLNASKANMKRIYFEKKNADINDPARYEAVMKDFKENVVGDLTALYEDVQKSHYHVIIRFKMIDSNSLSIQIENNVGILPLEQERISERLIKAKAFKDFSDAYEEMYDETEGAGLGIILTIMLLKNSGISPDHFTISSAGEKTIASILVPYQLKPEKITTEIKSTIEKEVDLLPTFPQLIVEIQKMCEDPNIDLSAIASKIETDPALAANIFKLANSAGFMSSKRIETIQDALVRIGLKNLKIVLLAAGAKEILNNKYKKFEITWHHCMKVAYYGRMIAMKYKMANVADQIFVGGLLHDMGKIVILYADLKLSNWINTLVESRGMSSATILEEVSIGISHSEIGELIAKKWNFNDFLCETIKYHHSPLMASEANKALVYTIYLANELCGIESKKYDYYFIDPEIRSYFNILDENECLKLHESLKESYEKMQALV